MQIVWFKRDLRVEDHEALAEAARHGDVLPLYVLEPNLWQQKDLSFRQFEFLRECLVELEESLANLGLKLTIKVGEVVDVLQKINAQEEIKGLFSHVETWNGWTYERDKQVKKWAQVNDVPWRELRQNGVVRALRNRDGWGALWYDYMKKSVTKLDEVRGVTYCDSDVFPESAQLGLNDDGCFLRQKGGRKQALKLLESFLFERGKNYSFEMSSPVTAFESCSRLSAHFAFGTLSIREAFQAAQKRQMQIKDEKISGKWLSALRSFSTRLRWHCHFIQKLEDEPRLEFENLHPAYDGLRENEFCEEKFAAWQNGQTGFPLVDACMRALKATGWLNFRMRAMVMSFASYHLWLHWQRPALYLARMFTDYEPGIHYSQIQMQSGTTGINAIRIYSPVKQSYDQDPNGEFISRWVPELKELPKEAIHTPWKLNFKGYVAPIVDEKIARKEAASKLYGVRGSESHRNVAAGIVEKHASRKKVRRSVKKHFDESQGSFDFD